MDLDYKMILLKGRFCGNWQRQGRFFQQRGVFHHFDTKTKQIRNESLLWFPQDFHNLLFLDGSIFMGG